MTNQEVLDVLRTAGLDIKSVSSTVDDSDLMRAFAPKINPNRKAAAAPLPPNATVRHPAPPAAPAAAPAAPAAPVAVTPAASAPAAEAVKIVTGEKPAAPAKAEAPAPVVTPVPAPAAPEAPKAAEPKAAPKAKPVVEPPKVPAKEEGPAPAEAHEVQASKPAPAEVAEPVVAAVQPVAAAVEAVPPVVKSEAPRPDAGAPPRSAKPPVRPPRGPRLRLEDMPTVVGAGVPLRKGAKPSGNVVTKEELARLQAEKEVRAEAARKAAAAAAAAPKPAQPEGAGPAAGPRPGPRPAPPAAGGGGAPGRPAFRAPAAPGAWTAGGAPAPAAAPAAAPRTGAAPSRVRRGDDKPARRRVIIDSQAGRKGGRGGTRGGPHGLSDADRPALKKKVAPGVESPVKIKSGASVKELGEALEIGAGELIKTLMKLGEMVTITQSLADDVITILAGEFERQVAIQHAEEEKEGLDQFVDDPADLSPRAPVVTIMGHVDHGKTSLLDAIRETEVVKSEAGGITQHIGAYQVTHNEKRVTFLDTPGHEAFTAMRARGAQATDIAVIVVAANDGVMPQTLEAISHAKAAAVPILVAINKMDLPDANSDHVKQQLSNEGLIPEAWGGETVMVEVSAKKKMNLEELMDMILLVAEVQDLKANAKAPGSGVVIEAQLDVGRGPVATVLVQRGTLRVGDAIVSGEAYGKVKAMFDFTGVALTKAMPSVPAQVLGFNTLPVAGDFVMVLDDEREARQKAEQRTTRLRAESLAKSRGGSSLDEFYRRLKEGRVKELPIVIKGDVGGSVEALEESLRNITHPEVKVEVIFAGVGGINESDIMLASASKAVVIGFNVRPSVAAKALAEQEGVDVRTYRVIYKAIEDVEAALVGMLEPEKVEEELGSAEIRTVFRASRIGTIAGCYVLTGKIVRSAKIRLVRDGAIIHEGTIGSLKRFADDQREVAAGYECGLHVDGYDDIHEGDIVEAYEIKEVARTQ